MFCTGYSNGERGALGLPFLCLQSCGVAYVAKSLCCFCLNRFGFADLLADKQRSLYFL